MQKLLFMLQKSGFPTDCNSNDRPTDRLTCDETLASIAEGFLFRFGSMIYHRFPMSLPLLHVTDWRTNLSFWCHRLKPCAITVQADTKSLLLCSPFMKSGLPTFPAKQIQVAQMCLIWSLTIGRCPCFLKGNAEKGPGKGAFLEELTLRCPPWRLSLVRENLQ